MVGVRIAVTAVLVVLISGCGGGKDTSTPASPTPTSPTTAAATVTIQPNARTSGTAAFVPNPLTVSSGAVVTWSNTDSTTHDMVSDTGVWDSGRIAPGGSFNFTFPSKGSFPYHCSIHSGMVGALVVQ